ncbi:hypothetical protein CHS0354_015349 [Potamilus streckersoni]|uniref:Large ribosomal subunit protein mL40 n=1 Tax=Potamilus streckersoni TaxID=2493646 RepID=A0AAE0RY55_9BIVA|nr:hypothetical protein CHS0354_015349 [Potamilus streckersoni]
MAAFLAEVVLQITRLSLQRCYKMQGLTACRSIHMQGAPLLFQTSQILSSEPMKRKKRDDPAVAAARIARKKKNIEKLLKQKLRLGRILKPIEEIDGNFKLQQHAHELLRERTQLTFEESEERALLHKDWTRHRLRQFIDDMNAVHQVIASQQKALRELREESEELYQQAIQTDNNSLPFEWQGPTATPPFEGYDSPDGEYVDTTRKY